MPAVNFTVVWPDGDALTYYSPSTIVLEHFVEGKNYSLSDFESRSHSALQAASERVRAKFGYACTAAAAEQEKIAAKIAALKQQGVTGNVQLTHLG